MNISKILKVTASDDYVIRVKFTREELDKIKKAFKKGFGKDIKWPEGW